MTDDGNEAIKIEVLKNPVLTFLHAWYLGDDPNSIMRNAVTSFSIDQLEEATKMLRTRFPLCGAPTKHRTSDKFVNDILGGFKILGDNNVKVEYTCSSVEMRTVKASTILFSEDEPVVAVQMRDMKKEITDLKNSQDTLFKLLDERLPDKSAPTAATFAEAVQKKTNSKGNVSLSVPKQFRDPSLPPLRKRSNSVVFDESAIETVEEDSDDGWEKTREDKRKDKLRKMRKRKRKMIQISIRIV